MSDSIWFDSLPHEEQLRIKRLFNGRTSTYHPPNEDEIVYRTKREHRKELNGCLRCSLCNKHKNGIL